MAEKTFSQKLHRLEEIVAKLESPNLELEEGLKLLEEGVALHKDCQKVLTQSQAKITKLLDNNSADVSQKQASEVDTETASLFESVSDESNDSTESSESNDKGLPF